jgi:hypothetical protein
MCKQEEMKNLKINNRIRDIDGCIFGLVKLLNDNGMPTIACCCGHGNQPASIVFKDGREIRIMKNFKDARKVDTLFPPINRK